MCRAILLLMCCTFTAGAQSTRAPGMMELQQTRYELRTGEPARISATSDTLDFLLKAKTRSIEFAGKRADGLVVGPNRQGDLVLAASLRAKPGEYAVTISATSADGEVRESALTAVVQPQAGIPSSATRPPVVLLNGWEFGYTGGCPISNSSSDTFGNLAQYLVSDGVPAVFLFDNCVEGPNEPIEALGSVLGPYLNSIQYDTGAQVPQIDLVGFSLGGLIARSYLAGLQQSGQLTPPTPTLVRDLVLIAVPNFGSVVATNYASQLGTGTQSAELVAGSSFLWGLATWNQHSDDLRGVNAIAVVGNAGTYVPSLSSTTILNNASDGMVSETSASLGFAYGNSLSTTRIVPYCQVDPSAYFNPSFGTYLCNAAGIANVTSTSQQTGQIVRSFLSGTTDWMSIGTAPSKDAYLSQNGGMFVGVVNATGSYVSDLTQVVWGSLQLASGQDLGTLFFADFIKGTGAFTATSASLGKITNGGYTLANGYFSATLIKQETAIQSVTPLLSTSGRVVNAGTTITITGATFGASLCGTCKVVATPTGSSTGQILQVTSWSNTAIKANLPSNLTGLLVITVVAPQGTGSIYIFAATSTAATITSTPASLQFTFTVGGTVPAAQTIQIANSGNGALAWSATASDSWFSVSPASGTSPSTLTVSISPAALSAGTFNGSIQIASAGASNTPLTVAVTLTVTGTQAAAPNITAVVNDGSFQAGSAPATWLAIFGTNLSTTTYTWQTSDFVNGLLPASLQGVSVTIDGLPAYIGYVSPTQINVLAPDDTNTGPLQVQVTVAGQQSNSLTVQESQFSPAFFTIDNGLYVAALHADYTLVGSSTLLPGVTTSPAQPGETIQLYGTGFGPANPAVPTAQLVTTPTALANSVQVTIGGVAAQVSFAGLVESGLYQINVTVPQLPNGDAAVVATVGGVATQSGVSVTVQQ